MKFLKLIFKAIGEMDEDIRAYCALIVLAWTCVGVFTYFTWPR